MIVGWLPTYFKATQLGAVADALRIDRADLERRQEAHLVRVQALQHQAIRALEDKVSADHRADVRSGDRHRYVMHRGRQKQHAQYDVGDHGTRRSRRGATDSRRDAHDQERRPPRYIPRRPVPQRGGFDVALSLIPQQDPTFEQRYRVRFARPPTISRNF